MAKGITFDDRAEADEYADIIREQGLIANIAKNMKTGQFFVSISSPKVKKQEVRDMETQSEPKGTGISKAARMIGKGFGDIGRSLGTASTNKRPRISQMPGSRREIGISQQINLDKLKMPGLRGKTLSGRNRVR